MSKLIKKISWRLFIYISIPVIIAALVITNLPSYGMEITGIEFSGEATLPTSTTFQNTPFGGLSGITYDAKNQLYYAISDDRSERAPARFYTLKLNLRDGQLAENGIEPVAVTFLKNKAGERFASGTIDGEGIALTNRPSIYVSSEGDADQQINPFIKEFSLTSGQEISSLPIPKKFLPSADGKTGIRNNLAFEPLTIVPSSSISNQKYLYTATENALIQDGEEARPGTTTMSRILQFNLATQKPEKEFLYITDPVTSRFSSVTGKYANGIPDLLAIDDKGHFLSIERAFTGLGFTIRLFQVSLNNATDISNIESLKSVDLNKIQPVEKKLLLDLKDTGVFLDNIEGLTLGPRLANGQPTLILVSDNNFQNLQRTQVLAFKLKIKTQPLLDLLRRIRNAI